MSTLPAILIPPSGDPVTIQLPSEPNACAEAISERVGGYLETVPNPLPGVAAYINDEGKYCGEGGLPLLGNPIATQLASEYLRPGDYIAGPMVLTGFNPRTGEEVGLPTNITPQAVCEASVAAMRRKMEAIERMREEKR